tara:strand:- start:290 stop:1189 length:900 start_codon:yes stop_codon:yes gene_type:complete
MKVTFIGIGLMGKPIAINLIKAGVDVTVVNRSQGKIQELVALGARNGGTPSEGSATADVVILCLQGEDIVELVLNGDNGVLSSIKPGVIIVDHSTIHPESAKRFAALCETHQATYIDAPVSGTGKVAWDGKLTIMAGGDPVAFAKIKPILAHVSIAAHLMGPVGSGNITKLLNNLIGDVNQIIIMETFALAASLNLDMNLLLEVLRSASANSRQLERIGPKLLARDFGNQTSHLYGHHVNQLRTRWLSEQVGLQLPLRELAEVYWEQAIEAGFSASDPLESIKMIEAQNGVIVSGEASN